MRVWEQMLAWKLHGLFEFNTINELGTNPSTLRNQIHGSTFQGKSVQSLLGFDFAVLFSYVSLRDAWY